MSQIYEVDFAEDQDGTKTIAELFESIQLYRSQGKSIAKIYRALCRSGLWKKTLSSFSSEYYQYRKQHGAEKSTTVVERTVDSDPITQAAKSETGRDRLNKRLRTISDMTLEEKRAISAQVFKRKREGKL